MATCQRKQSLSHEDEHSDTGHEQHVESKRYNSLVSAIKKALLETRNSIDTKAAVAECFDVSMYADGDGGQDETTDMLANLIGGVIDRVNDQITSEIDIILKREGAREKLVALDRIIDEFEREEREKSQAEDMDRMSSREAVALSCLPPEISPDDVFNFHAYSIKMKERDGLLAEIASVEAENESLQKEIEQGRVLIGAAVAGVETKGKYIEKSATACSYSGVG
uniref:Uncharacterized protein n=1 Tax=Trieres chinensis TaxID=1514140 RepID=A0A7S2A1Q6_TRICV